MNTPIRETAVALRVNPANWPVGLDQERSGVGPIRRGFDLAGRSFAELQAAKKEIGANQNLTAAGKYEALVAWATPKLNSLRTALTDIRERSEVFEKEITRQIREAAGPAPESQEDIEGLKEIRSWLRSLTQAERERAIFRAVERGDRAVLRAVMRSPSPALLNVKSDMMDRLTRASYARLLPDKTAHQEDGKKAFEVTLAALDGVIRYMETAVDPLTAAPDRALRK